jgi:hypothetical protein
MKRDEMVSSLKRLFVPALRERGFKGSLPHFRRPIEGRIDLLTIQFDPWGGGFVIEVSKCAPDGITLHWGEHVPPNRVRAWDVHPRHRPRLGAPGPGEDGYWFRSDDGTPTDKVAALAVSYLQEADRWWTRSEPWWNKESG